MPIPQDVFLAMCASDPEKVYRMFSMMEQTIERLEERVRHLEAIVHKDSHNSSKPPSSDIGRTPKSLRKKSKRHPGGQPGHQGYTLQRTKNPDHAITHPLQGSCECGRDLTKGKFVDYERRQVADIPVQPQIETTEHCAEIRQCRCGKTHTAAFPETVQAPIQYGERIRAVIVYLCCYQMLSQSRTIEAIRDLCGVTLSEGTLNNILRQAYGSLEKTEEAIKVALGASALMHLDETGMYVNGKRVWEHSSSTEKLTYYFCHEKRGAEAIKEGGILREYPGRILHDGWKSYFDFGCQHALCNAHHLRELVFVKDEYHQRWAGTMIDLLCRIKRTVDRAREADRFQLATATIQRYEKRFGQIIAAGFRANPKCQQPTRRQGQRGRIKQHPARNLLMRLDKYRSETLAFMYDFNVPFDNNLAERDLRMTKVKQKVSGCFRSVAGAQAFCRIRGYISTVKKHGYNILEYLQNCFLFPGIDLLRLNQS
jgi:transposase